METTIQKTNNRLIEIRDQIILLLRVYSKIKRSIYPGDGILSMDGDFSFEDLPADAISIQDKILKDFNVHFAVVEALIINSAKQHISEINQNKNLILRYILQDHMTWDKTIDEAIDRVKNCFIKIIQTLNLIYPINDQRPILIPDTNALYSNGNLDMWKFDEFNSFTIILTPSVLRDLDKHKIEHKNVAIRSKANKLINILKEYRRRGKLIEGVTIKKDTIDLKSRAFEPDFSKTLKWLDEKNEDDRLIAESLEIMRADCNRPAFIVTSDINLQNKCEVADFSFLEPPEVIKKVKRPKI